MLADLHVSYVVFMFGWAGLPPLAFVGPSCLMLRVFLFSVSWLVLMWARLASRWARPPWAAVGEHCVVLVVSTYRRTTRWDGILWMRPLVAH